MRAVYQPLTPSLLESIVLARPFFDRHGLIVATEDHRPIGFAHAGFAVNADGTALDTSRGTTCMLVLHQRCSTEVALELLARCEDYLVRHGATCLYGGGAPWLAPYYLGLYGGATVPGILASDASFQQLLRTAGYIESGRRRIMQLPLAGFRPIVDRQQMQLKRSMQVETYPDPPSATWWEACTEGLTDRVGFAAVPRGGGVAPATALFWDMEPLASGWGVHARGLTRLEVSSAVDSEAITTYLLGESLRLMAADGATLAEIQTADNDLPLQQVLHKLGFREVEQAVELHKVVAVAPTDSAATEP